MYLLLLKIKYKLSSNYSTIDKGYGYRRSFPCNIISPTPNIALFLTSSLASLENCNNRGSSCGATFATYCCRGAIHSLIIPMANDLWERLQDFF